MHDQAMKKTSIQDYVEWNDVLSLKGERIKREKRRRTNACMLARTHASQQTKWRRNSQAHRVDNNQI